MQDFLHEDVRFGARPKPDRFRNQIPLLRISGRFTLAVDRGAGVGWRIEAIVILLRRLSPRAS